MQLLKATVTGASSPIMNRLIDRLCEAGYDVTAVSRNERMSESRAKVKWVTCDLSLPGQDFSFLKDSSILFHGAAISNFYNQEDYLNNNLLATIHITKAAAKYGIRKLVFISSIIAGYVYGDYGISKIKSEEYIAANLSNWLIIRPSQLYGYSDENPIDKLISTITNKNFIPCPVGDKPAIYPLHFTDLVNEVFNRAIILDQSSEIVEITGPTAYNYKKLAREIAQILKRKTIIVPIPRVFIMLVYHTVRKLKLKVGIYPDQLFRLYHGNTSIQPHKSNFLSLPAYIEGKSRK